MFKIDPITKKIELTRGDIACITVRPKNKDGTDYTLQVNDIVRFKVFKKGHCEDVFLQKDVKVLAESTEIDISLTSEDTKIGEIINRPVKYWYEIELNPDTDCQTIVGYELNDKNKGVEKLFILLPEGGDKE